MQDEVGRDHVVRGLREQISDNDRLIVEAVNKRLQLVARLRDYKASRDRGGPRRSRVSRSA
jgi:chorismate mutase